MKNFYSLIGGILLLGLGTNAMAQVTESDSLALVAIYDAGNGPSWTNVTKWKDGASLVSQWEGVKTANGRVTELYLNNIDLGGTLSPEIGKLTALTRFEIQNAPKLKGSIPKELWSCTNIGRLQIKFTGLTGGIPSDGLENMIKLYEINFEGTYLGNEIPDKVYNLPSLTHAYLHRSGFTGQVPQTIPNATKLVRLYLQGNKLTGPLPLANINGNKAKVELTGNLFSFQDARRYQDNKQNFASLVNDYQLAKDTVHAKVTLKGSITLNGLVDDGEAFAWFKDGATEPLGSDEDLQVMGNGFDSEGQYVCIAQSSLVDNFNIRSVYNLKLDITDRQRDSLALVEIYKAGDGANWTITGSKWLTEAPINEWQGVTVANDRVTILYLNNIDMGGTLSPYIGQLTALTRFEIQNAPKLNGSIPSELWNCTKIGRLQIKFTGLTGGIPQQGLEKMTSLYEINFESTNLGGEIPAKVYELPSLTHAYLHRSGFTGVVPASVTKATKLKRFYLQGNKLQGPLPYLELNGSDIKVELTGNFFSFNDVKPYHDNKAKVGSMVNDFQYAQPEQKFTFNAGDLVKFNLNVADGDSYVWFFNAGTEPVATDPAMEIASVSAANVGSYTCKVQSGLVSNFDIRAIFTIEEVKGGANAVSSVDQHSVSVFPNPFSNSVTVNGSTNIQSVVVTNITGKIVYKADGLNDTKTTINTSSFAKGIYFISVDADGLTSVTKVIKR
jgi:Leucine-rich repeat (LRR) protein